MKSKLFFVIILISTFSLNLKAEIAYIDINQILKTSEVGKYLNLHIQKKKYRIFKKI